MSAADVEAYVDAAAAAIGLPIDPAHRPGVVRYVALAAQMAELVMTAPLGVADDPAEAFVPIAAEPPDGDPARASTPRGVEAPGEPAARERHDAR